MAKLEKILEKLEQEKDNIIKDIQKKDKVITEREQHRHEIYSILHKLYYNPALKQIIKEIGEDVSINVYTKTDYGRAPVCHIYASQQGLWMKNGNKQPKTPFEFAASLTDYNLEQIKITDLEKAVTSIIEATIKEYS